MSDSTRAHTFRHLRAFFKWATAEGLVARNPMQGMTAPRVGWKEAEFVTETVFSTFVAALAADAGRRAQKRTGNAFWLLDAVELAAWTGMRLGELCALRWADVSESTGLLTVRNRDDFRSKTGHDRHIVLLPGAAEVLQRIAERSGHRTGHVLTGEGGKPLGASYLSHAFKRAVKRHGLPEGIHFHSLRHTYVSWAVMRGVDMNAVATQTGHSSTEMTRRYAHLSPEHIKGALHGAFGAPMLTAGATC